MKVTRSISLAASGDNGLGLTHPLDCNAWLIDSGEGLILVDAGVNLDNLRIEEEIAADGYRLSDIRYLVVTHAHADHAAGVPHFLRRTGARLVADAHEAGVLGDQSLLDRTMAEYIEAGLYPEGFSFPGAPAGQIVRDGERLRLGRLELTCLVLPGHTGGGLCLYGRVDGKQVLFAGDVLFFGGRINLLSTFDSDLLRYRESILRLEGLPVDALFPGHLQPVLNRADRVVRKAADGFRSFSIPPTLL
ncbi:MULTISPECIES: MBL fold metallo-hydrolase [Anaerotruncus]|uniref:MBL fold metallo-hydrolase n=1 Tax=Anaerotruncus TaxID=244127 RepID=UPI0020809C49|nr:MBL fold metallo-hydrolase [Anaerotruncus massiliensis (ex Togo et al. 2019)]GKH46322.1 MBL fold metallo-hydrolase [Oscillospiraceae bacterium]